MPDPTTTNASEARDAICLTCGRTRNEGANCADLVCPTCGLIGLKRDRVSLLPDQRTPLPDPAPVLRRVEDEVRVPMEMAVAHIEELEEAWRNGALCSCDGHDGERANRNLDVRVALRRGLDALRAALGASR